jgi:hypothetical protein
MKLDLALRELHRSEQSLTRELLTVSDRHHAEHEIHHVARDLAHWSQRHVGLLAEAAHRYGVHLRPGVSRSSGLLAPVLTTASELARSRAEPGVLLLADLRGLYRKAAGVSLDWELLAQGAQAVKDSSVVELVAECHPQTLRQMTWAKAMLKALSPQILAS